VDKMTIVKLTTDENKATIEIRMVRANTDA
jgi:hypothetical protein